MSTVIFKYPFEVAGMFQIPMPKGAEILAVQLQGGQPCIWARVDPKAPRVLRQFWVLGTGHPMPEDPGDYVGTFQMDPFVWHLYAAAR
jgi:hypothetical protein